MEYQINFHQTFAPETEAIAHLMQLASVNNEYLTKEEISSLTTIPTGKSSGKVVPNILYAQAMGLISTIKESTKYSLTLTDLGKEILKEDPFLTEELTLWLCHYKLASFSSPAVMWSTIFSAVGVNKSRVLTMDNIETLLTQKLGLKKEIISIRNEKKGNKNPITPFKTGYITEKAFGPLNIINDTGTEIEFSSHKVSRAYKYLYAYLLLSQWEEILPSRTDITFDDLINTLGYGFPFMWNDSNVMEVLEMLEEESIIVLNRQLFPITIIKQLSSSSVLHKIYSFLI
ncbi:DUF4007 family protein [Psychrobacillus sp. PGGUH221]|uniref:DUF4007 family protein n=1 Tax=Psychrobacillus sp. PGGUH221 TaxID=3020058 RepID=UPI0035C74C19